MVIDEQWGTELPIYAKRFSLCAAPTNDELFAHIRQPKNKERLEEIIVTRVAEIDRIQMKKAQQPSIALQERLAKDLHPRVCALVGRPDTPCPAIVRSVGTQYITASFATAAAILAGALLIDHPRKALSTAILFIPAIATASKGFIKDATRSHYDPKNNRIYHGIWSRPDVLSLVHEVAHATQTRLYHEQYAAFIEGHAIGVERQFLEEALGEEPAGTKRCMESRLEDLRTCYHSICACNGLTPHPNVDRTNGKKKKRFSGVKSHAQNHYPIGDFTFAIAEAKHGPGIYAEALRNPRAVLE